LSNFSLDYIPRTVNLYMEEFLSDYFMFWLFFLANIMFCYLLWNIALYKLNMSIYDVLISYSLQSREEVYNHLENLKTHLKFIKEGSEDPLKLQDGWRQKKSCISPKKSKTNQMMELSTLKHLKCTIFPFIFNIAGSAVLVFALFCVIFFLLFYFYTVIYREKTREIILQKIITSQNVSSTEYLEILCSTLGVASKFSQTIEEGLVLNFFSQVRDISSNFGPDKWVEDVLSIIKDDNMIINNVKEWFCEFRSGGESCQLPKEIINALVNGIPKYFYSSSQELRRIANLAINTTAVACSNKDEACTYNESWRNGEDSSNFASLRQQQLYIDRFIFHSLLQATQNPLFSGLDYYLVIGSYNLGFYMLFMELVYITFCIFVSNFVMDDYKIALWTFKVIKPDIILKNAYLKSKILKIFGAKTQISQ